MNETLTAPPPGTVPLSQYAQQIGAKISTASQAARRGKVPGAVLVHVPGTPKPVWYVPADCIWRPGDVGRPKNTDGE